MHRGFIFIQTRLQARHGLRPDERSWQTVESQRELGNFLQSARQTGLKHWVSGLQAGDSGQLLETGILTLYRDYVDEVAAWAPRDWRAAVEWTKQLTYLPALLHLLKGNTAQPWMLQDPVLKPYTAVHHDQRGAAFLQSEYAPLLRAWQEGQSLVAAWAVSWQALWPDLRAGERANLLLLHRLVLQHLESFTEVAPDDAWQHRQRLEQRLVLRFRQFRYQPATIFVHLLLIALDVERLRGQILQRRLFRLHREDGA